MIVNEISQNMGYYITSKTLRGNILKKIYKWQIKISKYTPHQMSSGKFKLKQQWDITTYMWKWLKSRTLTKPNADKNMEQ